MTNDYTIYIFDSTTTWIYIDIYLKNWKFNFLAVQDSSISDIVCQSIGRSEPTNNQSLGSIKEQPLVDTRRH